MGVVNTNAQNYFAPPPASDATEATVAPFRTTSIITLPTPFVYMPEYGLQGAETPVHGGTDKLKEINGYPPQTLMAYMDHQKLFPSVDGIKAFKAAGPPVAFANSTAPTSTYQDPAGTDLVEATTVYANPVQVEKPTPNTPNPQSGQGPQPGDDPGEPNSGPYQSQGATPNLQPETQPEPQPKAQPNSQPVTEPANTNPQPPDLGTNRQGGGSSGNGQAGGTISNNQGGAGTSNNQGGSSDAVLGAIIVSTDFLE